jgi:hypothetical protein
MCFSSLLNRRSSALIIDHHTHACFVAGVVVRAKVLRESRQPSPESR